MASLPKLTVAGLFSAYCTTAKLDLRSMNPRQVIIARQSFYSGLGMLLLLQKESFGKLSRKERDEVMNNMLKECEEYMQ